MDAMHLDMIARAFAGASRRQAICLIGGLGLAVLHDLGETTAKRKKKKKHRKQPGDGGQSPSVPPPAPRDGCPDGQKPCDGGCIPRDQCCDNADCQISGQVCRSDTRQCACPGAFPDVCQGACVAACAPDDRYVRIPNTCACCLVPLSPSGGDARNCCSGRQVDFGGTMFCAGRAMGEACQFEAQCAYRNCVQGTCSGCFPTDDYCRDRDTCAFSGGTVHCLKALDGTTRCGVGLTDFACDLCRSDLDCDQGQGLGHFCAQATGPYCVCPQGQTFCARP
jgi:hypothetical protein